MGIITLPDNGGHLALAVFVMNGGGAAAMQKVISDLGAAVYESFTGKPLPPPAQTRCGRGASREETSRASTVITVILNPAAGVRRHDDMPSHLTELFGAAGVPVQWSL